MTDKRKDEMRVKVLEKIRREEWESDDYEWCEGVVCVDTGGDD